MDMATQQILSGLASNEGHSQDSGGGGLASFGNKVKEYWNTVKTDQGQQGGGGGGGGGYGGPSELQEVIAEKESLDGSFKHAARLLDQG